ncbi:Metallo-dependent phosphatase [Sistotremastrum niveocremeum HHB9708]|uniref:Metallo-dependent phosphatase n=1 Tax=Sistotremastrum niveocremeum HHB9708 TaxID=1314777 RepID=A0A164VRM8_9AGAM|nr:Metallo-dependent phosphatase [Sistotremastrum niveocremeum HHB9708]
MAVSIFGRLFRSTRSICAPITSIICFALLLTFLFILYQPTVGPGSRIQRIGWQSWETIGEATPTVLQNPLPIDPGSISSNATGNIPPEVDWWDVDEATDNLDSVSASLPLDVWAPLLPHDTGLTEIAIAHCFIPASMTEVCNPDTTPEDDAIKGTWVRVERDINKKSGIWYLYLYYRRSRRLDVPLISDIRLLSNGDESELPRGETWKKVPTSIRDGVLGSKSLFLWYKLGPALRDLSQSDRSNLITELDILFGESRPWPGFEKIETPIVPSKPPRIDPVWLTYRRGVKPVPKAKPLHFSHNGTFKVMQIADLHYSTSEGKCRDTDHTPCKNGDTETQSLLSKMLDTDKPDFIVFTGDQLNGQGTSWDARSVIAKFALEVTDRKIPWAAIFGNHDDEVDMNRADQMKLLQALPYSLASAGPSNVSGVGNYVLKVYSADASKTQLLTLYMVDSHAYSKGVIDWFGIFKPTEYDWLKPSQIQWFLDESAAINPILRPFQPDQGRDLGGVWTKRQGAPPAEDEAQRLAKPNGMMFFHIPIPESYLSPDIDPITNKPLDVGSDYDEDGSAKKNGGFFEKALMQAMESDDSQIPEVKIVGNGHSHVTDNCRRVAGIWLCFGGGGSYSGYGRVGFDRRFRYFDISDYGETIRTYKRTESGEVVDDMILAGKGAPPFTGSVEQ